MMVTALVLFLPVSGFSQVHPRIVGYYASWNSSVLPYNEIKYSNLTDIIVSFGSPQRDGSITYDAGIPFSQLVTAAHSAGTKVLISLGGAGSGASFSAATVDSLQRAKLIASIVNFLQANHYDGVDVDWETPANSAETSQLTSLIQEMRTSFERTDSSWLITMAVPATAYGGQHFDIQKLVNYVDWFNVMCYDFVGSWSTYSGQNSPLYQASDDPNQAGSDSNAVVYWVSRGGRGNPIPKDKLVLGIPFYSVQFNAPGLYKRLASSTISNPYYSDIVSDLASGWSYHWDEVSQVPFLLNPDTTQFITFEDTNSVKLKAEYAIRQQLGGVMIWELSQDLYNGGHPLLDAIANTFRNLTEVSPTPLTITGYRLYNNYPNPFNPSTVIRFAVPRAGLVEISVYDILGRKVETLTEGRMSSGVHAVTFSGSGFSSGVYFYTLTAEGAVLSKKMLYLK